MKKSTLFIMKEEADKKHDELKKKLRKSGEKRGGQESRREENEI